MLKVLNLAYISSYDVWRYLTGVTWSKITRKYFELALVEKGRHYNNQTTIYSKQQKKLSIVADIVYNTHSFVVIVVAIRPWKAQVNQKR